MCYSNISEKTTKFIDTKSHFWSLGNSWNVAITSHHISKYGNMSQLCLPCDNGGQVAVNPMVRGHPHTTRTTWSRPPALPPWSPPEESGQPIWASLKLMFRCSTRSPKEEKLGGPDAPPETQDLLGFAWFLGKPFGPQCTRSTKRVDQ